MFNILIDMAIAAAEAFATYYAATAAEELARRHLKPKRAKAVKRPKKRAKK